MSRLHNIRSPRRRTLGLTMIEVLISLVLMILLSVITVAGMIMHARMAQSSIEMEKIAENSRQFVDALQVAALDATEISIDTGPAGANTVVTLEKPDPNNTSAVIIKQFAYLDSDGDANTIKDNKIVERSQNTPSATTGKTVVEYCSKTPGEDVFSTVAGANKPLFAVNLRVGDRGTTYTADNAITGHGYQSFLISANFSKL